MDVEVLSKKVASFFIKRGLKPGDKCIYLTSDITKMFAIVIGVWRAGGVVCTSYAEDTQGMPYGVVYLVDLSEPIYFYFPNLQKPWLIA